MINLDFHTAGLLFVTLLSLIVAGHIIVLSLICCFSHSLEIQVIIQKVNACLLVFQAILAAALIVLYIYAVPIPRLRRIRQMTVSFLNYRRLPL